MMFGVLLRVIGSKVCFSPFLTKNHELTPWDLGQNFNFAKTFCIGKRSREMMFGVLLRVIGSKVEAKCFSPFLTKNHELTPWDLGQNFNFAKTFCIGKRSREMMFGVLLRVIGSKVEGK